MTDEQLDAIRARGITGHGAHLSAYSPRLVWDGPSPYDDLAALVSEVDRLRAQVAELEERDRSWHNASNWSAEELGRLRAQVAELEPLAALTQLRAGQMVPAPGPYSGLTFCEKYGHNFWNESCKICGAALEEEVHD